MYNGGKKLETQEKCVYGQTLSIFQRNRLPIEMANQSFPDSSIHGRHAVPDDSAAEEGRSSGSPADI
jgi:hypothetical protein